MTHLEVAGGSLSPVSLFLQADIVVKAVMVGLILASLWTWAIIIGHAIRIRRVGRGNTVFERDFWKAGDVDGFYETRGKEKLTADAIKVGERVSVDYMEEKKMMMAHAVKLATTAGAAQK